VLSLAIKIVCLASATPIVSILISKAPLISLEILFNFNHSVWPLITLQASGSFTLISLGASTSQPIHPAYPSFASIDATLDSRISSILTQRTLYIIVKPL
jgi:hypothetical protein